jgi:hypothetical protein
VDPEFVASYNGELSDGEPESESEEEEEIGRFSTLRKATSPFECAAPVTPNVEQMRMLVNTGFDNDAIQRFFNSGKLMSPSKSAAPASVKSSQGMSLATPKRKRAEYEVEVDRTGHFPSAGISACRASSNLAPAATQSATKQTPKSSRRRSSKFEIFEDATAETPSKRSKHSASKTPNIGAPPKPRTSRGGWYDSARNLFSSH